MPPVTLISPTGKRVDVDEAQAAAFRDEGFRDEHGGDVLAASQGRVEADRKASQGFLDQAEAAGLGLARGATFGASDVVADSLGVADRERQANLRSDFSKTSGLAEVVGGVAPALLTGGAGELGAVARLAPAGAAARVGLGIVERGAGRGALSAIGHAAAGGAAEGAMQSAGMYLSHAVLEDRDISGEALVAAAGEGAALGGLTGGAFGAAERGVVAVRKLLPKAAAAGADQAARAAEDGVVRAVSRGKALQTAEKAALAERRLALGAHDFEFAPGPGLDVANVPTNGGIPEGGGAYGVPPRLKEPEVGRFLGAPQADGLVETRGPLPRDPSYGGGPGVASDVGAGAIDVPDDLAAAVEQGRAPRPLDLAARPSGESAPIDIGDPALADAVSIQQGPRPRPGMDLAPAPRPPAGEPIGVEDPGLAGAVNEANTPPPEAQAPIPIDRARPQVEQAQPLTRERAADLDKRAAEGDQAAQAEIVREFRVRGREDIAQQFEQQYALVNADPQAQRIAAAGQQYRAAEARLVESQASAFERDADRMAGRMGNDHPSVTARRKFAADLRSSGTPSPFVEIADAQTTAPGMDLAEAKPAAGRRRRAPQPSTAGQSRLTKAQEAARRPLAERAAQVQVDELGRRAIAGDRPAQDQVIQAFRQGGDEAGAAQLEARFGRHHADEDIELAREISENADAIAHFEQARSDMVDALGPHAPPELVEDVAAFRKAAEVRDDAEVARMAHRVDAGDLPTWKRPDLQDDAIPRAVGDPTLGPEGTLPGVMAPRERSTGGPSWSAAEANRPRNRSLTQLVADMRAKGLPTSDPGAFGGPMEELQRLRPGQPGYTQEVLSDVQGLASHLDAQAAPAAPKDTNGGKIGNRKRVYEPGPPEAPGPIDPVMDPFDPRLQQPKAAVARDARAGDPFKPSGLSWEGDHAAAVQRQMEHMGSPAPANDVGPAPAAAGRRGGVLGGLADLGALSEALKVAGIHTPFDPDKIPIIGPLLGLYLKGRALMGVAGKLGGHLPATGNLRAAAKAAGMRDKIAGAVDSLLSLGQKAVGPKTAIATIAAAPVVADTLGRMLHDDGVKRKNDTLAEKLRARYEELQSASSNPDVVRKDVVQQLVGAGVTDPRLVDSAVDVAQRRMGYLADNAPKPPIKAPLQRGEWLPPPAEAARFARRIRAAYYPEVAISNIATGVITKEEVETLRAVYPRLYADAQTRLLEHASEIEHQLPHGVVVKLSTLFGVELTPTLSPAKFAAIQGAVPQMASPSSPPPPSGAPSKIADMYMTDSQRHQR